MKTESPNQPDAVNPARAVWFHIGYTRRGVTDPLRSAEKPMAPFAFCAFYAVKNDLKPQRSSTAENAKSAEKQRNYCRRW
jgi:hypothetical protein